jgi:hypothetical protein
LKHPSRFPLLHQIPTESYCISSKTYQHHSKSKRPRRVSTVASSSPSVSPPSKRRSSQSATPPITPRTSTTTLYRIDNTSTEQTIPITTSSSASNTSMDVTSLPPTPLSSQRHETWPRLPPSQQSITAAAAAAPYLAIQTTLIERLHEALMAILTNNNLFQFHIRTASDFHATNSTQIAHYLWLWPETKDMIKSHGMKRKEDSEHRLKHPLLIPDGPLLSELDANSIGNLLLLRNSSQFLQSTAVAPFRSSLTFLLHHLFSQICDSPSSQFSESDILTTVIRILLLPTIYASAKWTTKSYYINADKSIRNQDWSSFHLNVESMYQLQPTSQKSIHCFKLPPFVQRPSG